MSVVILIAIACAGGVAVALQAQFVGSMDRAVGTPESMFVTYVGGGLLMILWSLLARGGNLAAWKEIPSHALTAGVFGLIIIGTISYTVPRLGLANVLVIIVASQLLAGLLVDHFGLFSSPARPVDVSKVIGLTAILFGTWLTLK